LWHGWQRLLDAECEVTSKGFSEPSAREYLRAPVAMTT
jgi:hypothetical protein